eukprot:gene4446-biopygen3961
MPTLRPRHAHATPAPCPRYARAMPTLRPRHAHATPAPPKPKNAYSPRPARAMSCDPSGCGTRLAAVQRCSANLQQSPCGENRWCVRRGWQRMPGNVDKDQTDEIPRSRHTGCFFFPREVGARCPGLSSVSESVRGARGGVLRLPERPAAPLRHPKVEERGAWPAHRVVSARAACALSRRFWIACCGNGATLRASPARPDVPSATCLQGCGGPTCFYVAGTARRFAPLALCSI